MRGGFWGGLILAPLAGITAAAGSLMMFTPLGVYVVLVGMVMVPLALVLAFVGGPAVHWYLSKTGMTHWWQYAIGWTVIGSLPLLVMGVPGGTGFEDGIAWAAVMAGPLAGTVAGVVFWKVAVQPFRQAPSK